MRSAKWLEWSMTLACAYHGPCCSPDHDDNIVTAKERKKKGRKGERRASILGDTGTVDSDFAPWIIKEEKEVVHIKNALYS
jgi:hypothetical protein